MKIALPVHHFDPMRGGLESWCDQFARWLAGRGHEVHVVCFQSAPAESAPGLHIHQVELPMERKERAPALRRCIQAHAPEIIHDTGCLGAGNLYHPLGGSVISTWRETLRSFPAHERWWQRWNPGRRRWLRERLSLELRHIRFRRSLVVAISRQVASDLVEDYGLASDRIRNVPNGVDLKTYHLEGREVARKKMRQSLGVDDDEIVHLIVAHNYALKGLDALLRALVHVPGRLVVVGRGEVAPYARKAAVLGLGGRVIWAGLVADTRPYFWAADVYVHPAYYDPCSLSTLEAMACGLPVITTARNGVSEMIEGKNAGFILPQPDDRAGLVRCLNEMMDAGKRRVMSANAVACARNQDREDSFKQLESLYPEAAREFPLHKDPEEAACRR